MPYAPKELNTTEGKNRFRYSSFRERIESLNFDVVHQVERTPEDLTVTSSHFRLALDALEEKFITSSFVTFLSKVKPLSNSLAQVLHHKSEISGFILELLDTNNPIVLEPILNSIPPLARDLQEEFYPDFLILLPAIVKLVKLKDSGIVEWGFNAIAYSFKYLAKIIINHLPDIFSIIKSLIEERDTRSYLRTFASESFGFLVRRAKTPHLKETIGVIIQNYQNQPSDELLDGTCLLLLESIKNIDNRLHSRCNIVLTELFERTITSDLDSDAREIKGCSSVFRISSVLINEICNYTRKEHIEPLASVVMRFASKLPELAKNLGEEDDGARVKELTFIIAILNCYVQHRKGSCVLDYPAILTICSDLCAQAFQPDIIVTLPSLTLGEIYRLITLLFTQADAKDIFNKGKLIMASLFQSKNVKNIVDFCQLLVQIDYIHFAQLTLPHLLKLVVEDFDSNGDVYCLLLSEMIDKNLHKNSGTTLAFYLSPKGQLQFPSQEPIDKINRHLSEVGDWGSMFEVLLNIDGSLTHTYPRAALVSNMLTLLGDTKVKLEPTMAALGLMLESLLEFLSQGNNNNVNAEESAIHQALGEAILGQLIQTVVSVTTNGQSDSVTPTQLDGDDLERSSKRRKKEQTNSSSNKSVIRTSNEDLVLFWKQQVLPKVLGQYQSKPVLKAMAQLISALKFQAGESNQDLFDYSHLQEMYRHLLPALQSYDSNIRLPAYEILSCFTNNAPNGTMDQVFGLCISVDRMPTNLAGYRDKLVPLRKLGVLVANGNVPELDLLVPSLCLGMFSVNFQPMWSDAVKGLQACAKHKPKIISDVLMAALEQLSDGTFTSGFDRVTLVGEVLKGLIRDIDAIPRLHMLLPKLLENREEHAMSLELGAKKLLNMVEPRKDRLDHWNVYEWVLKTFKELPHLAEHRVGKINDLFLDLYRRYTQHESPEEIEEDKPDNEDDVDKMEDDEKAIIDTKPEPSSQPLRRHLVLYLEIYSRFQKMIKMEARPQFEPIFETLLASGDDGVQGLALKCLETYKYPFISEYSSRLHNLLDDVKFRDEITTFPIGPDSDVIESGHRSKLLPYLVKLLFGRLISSKGRKSNRNNLATRRTVILSYLSGMLPEELYLLFDLLFKPFHYLTTNRSDWADNQFTIDPELSAKTIPLKTQQGFMYLLSDVVKQLGASLHMYYDQILAILLYLLDNANVELSKENPRQALKDIRQQGLKRLVGLFNVNVKFNFNPFMSAIFSSVVSPKLTNLASENIQAPSAVLELFLTWSKKQAFAKYLVDYDDRVLTNLFGCMSSPHVKGPVVMLVIEVVENLFKLDDEIREQTKLKEGELSPLLLKVLVPNATALLNSLEITMLNPTIEPISLRNSLFKRQIGILSRTAGFIEDGEQAHKLLNLLAPSLHKSSKVLDEYVKRDIIVILAELVKKVPELQTVSSMFHKIYQSFARLFFTIQLRDSRLALIRIFISLAEVDPELKEVIQVIIDLNAFSKRRLDEPDYDKRLAAFTKVHDALSSTITPHQWLPLLHNFLYFLKDEDEMSLRNGGSFGLIRFMQVASQLNESELKEEMMGLMTHVVFPTIKRGLRFKSETVQSEFIQLLGQAVTHFPTTEPFSDLVELLGTSNKMDDEEREDDIDQSNFFVGIYHIQIARRVKVLTKLSAMLNRAQGTAKSPIRPSLLANVFLPICSDFIFSEKDHTITHESIRAISAIARHLSWTFYNSLFRRYYGLLVKKPEQESLFLKIMFAILDGFKFDLSHVKSGLPSKSTKQTKAIELDGQSDDEELEGAEISKESGEHIYNTVINFMVPDLLRLLEKCPDDRVSDRIPLALILTRMLKKLPQAAFKKQLPSLIMNMCNLLKSRDPSTRDTVRSTLVNVAQLLGAPHLHFIVKEMHTTLDRGFMRHILSYTVNALITALAPTIKVGEIDHSVPQLMTIIIEDMFGEASKEKEAQDYTGKQKEVRSRKSHLTLELLASVTSFKSLGLLLSPIKLILEETDNGKVLIRVDEALARISTGLIRNKKFDAKILLTFCHGLIEQNIVMCQPTKETNKGKKSLNEITFTVHTKRMRLDGQPDYFATNAHKFVEFGMGLLLTALKQERLELESDELIKMLDPFVPVMGESLYSNYQLIVIQAIKVMLHLVKHPLPSLTSSLPVMVKRIMAIVHQINTIQSDVVQAGFKLLTHLIKHNVHVTIKNQDLQFLIQLILPDLEEPSRQSTTFGLIRAILSRQLLVSSLYDLVDEVGKLMVTNQVDRVRAMCREVYLQFLLDYPQGTQRLDQQMKFLINNLAYQFESGRESVMEVLNAVLLRVSPKLLAEYIEMLFLGLVVALVNDESNRCREMAGLLIKTLLTKLDIKGMDLVTRLMSKWAQLKVKSIEDATNKPQLKRTGLQCLGLLIESLGDRSNKYQTQVMETVTESISQGLDLLNQAQTKHQVIQEKNPGIDMTHLDIPTHWELIYYGLNTFSKLTTQFPNLIYHQSTHELWAYIPKMLLHPHAWIRLSSSRLLSQLFKECEPTTLKAKGSNEILPALELGELYTVAYSLSVQIKSEEFGDELASLWVKNLFFIARAFYHNKSVEESQGNDENDEEEEDKEEREEGEFTAAQAQAKALKHPLAWLIKRLSYSARLEPIHPTSKPKKLYIFQLYAAICSALPATDLQPHLIPILAPLIRTISDPLLRQGHQPLQELVNTCTDIDTFIKNKVGPTLYMEATNQVSNRIRQVRSERKIKISQSATANPEAFAQRKQKLNAKKTLARKAKIGREKEERVNRVNSNNKKGGDKKGKMSDLF